MLQTNMKTIITIFILTMFPLIISAQKTFMVFNVTTGVPVELTLVDSNGVKIGYSNFYNKAGILIMSLMYKNGVPNGQWTRYDDKTGKIKESFIYNEYGRISRSIAYKEGVKVTFPQAQQYNSQLAYLTSDYFPSGFTVSGSGIK